MGIIDENKGSATMPHLGRVYCNKNAIKVYQIPALTDPLHSMFTYDTCQSKYFQKHIQNV